MASSNDLIVAALFKPAANGWIFRAPNPWLFVRAPHYVVNDEQRARIAEVLRIKRPVRSVFIVSLMLLAWAALVSVAMWAFSGQVDQPNAREVLTMFVLIFGPVFVGLSISGMIRQWRIAPILADAARTDQTIINRDIIAMAAPAQAKRSVRYLLLMIALWALVIFTQCTQLLLREARHPLFTDALSWLIVGVVVLGLVNVLLALAQVVRNAERGGS